MQGHAAQIFLKVGTLFKNNALSLHVSVYEYGEEL